jgi:hypothetical protein
MLYNHCISGIWSVVLRKELYGDEPASEAIVQADLGLLELSLCTLGRCIGGCAVG